MEPAERPLLARPRRRARAAEDPLAEELSYWLERLRAVDEVLQPAALSLIRLARYAGLDPKFPKPAGAEPFIPAWVAEEQVARRPSYVVHALCCSTLQRLQKTARRWPWPAKEFREPLDRLRQVLPGTIPAQPTPKLLSYFGETGDVFGRLNPLTSAEIFWVMHNAGTRNAHGPAGLVATFGMLWALYAASEAYRRSARDTRALPATIVSKCLMPLKRFEATIVRRSELYRDVARVCRDLRDAAAKSTQPSKRWSFASGLDKLLALLLELSNVSVYGDDFALARGAIQAIAEEIKPGDATRWQEVEAILRDTIIRVGEATKNVLKSSDTVLDLLRVEVCRNLSGEKTRESARANYRTDLRPRAPGESTESYWQRIQKAAGHALRTCRKATKELVNAVKCCERASQTSPPVDVEESFECLAGINDEVAGVFRKAVTPAVQWSRRTVRQEIAYASAGNDAEFDAAELLSAIAVSERWDQISELEVADAIRKALRASRPDGSWVTGQPIYTRDHVLGVWPSTSDIVWLLVSAVNGKPRITDADDALMNFVDWLSRNLTRVEIRDRTAARVEIFGWPSETRDATTIDLWTTAGSINALLEIRELIEHRLWQLCQERFFVLPSVRPLEKIDPVDLGARHDRRLHHRLRMAAIKSRGPQWQAAQYSFVLHGPPGSSKTAVAEALGSERAYGQKPRVVRVTPADFTRRGEASIDAEARFIFDLLSHVRGVTIIFDEIDDLLRRREQKGDATFLKLIVPAMLNRLQDLRDAAPRQEISFILAMNYVDNVEPALLRAGRIDENIPVAYPDPWSRENTLDRIIQETNAATRIDRDLRTEIVDRTAGWPWPTFNRMCTELFDRPGTIGTNEVGETLNSFGKQDEGRNGYARWTPSSPQLTDELAHFVLAYGRTFEACAAEVDQIVVAPKEGGTMPPAELVQVIADRLQVVWANERRPVVVEAQAEAMGAEYDVAKEAVTFRVWAPSASAVSVKLSDGHAFPMVAEAADVWSLETQAAGPRSLYQYEITVAGAPKPFDRNDPYAREVTSDGAWSVVREPWHGSDFQLPPWHEAVIYQLDPGMFRSGGSRYDHVDDVKLRRLQELGVNIIDLVMPTAPPYQRDDEYSPIRVLERFEKLGGADELQKLVKRAHDFGIGVIAGVSTKYLLGQGTVDLRNFTGATDERPFGAWFDVAGRVETPYGPRPRFDERRVVDLLRDNACWWAEEIGVDGLRWDGFHFVRSVDATEDEQARLDAGWDAAKEVVRTVRSAVTAESVPRQLLTIAGDVPEDAAVASRKPGTRESEMFGTHLSMSFARALRAALLDPGAEALKRLADAINYTRFGDMSTRVVFAESREWLKPNKRLAELLRNTASQEELEARCILAAAVVLTSPGIPMLLQGQEYASNAHAVDWDEWERRKDLVDMFRQLIKLRRDLPPSTTRGLKGHRVFVEADVNDETKVLTVHRWNEGRPPQAKWGHEVVTVFNFSNEAKPDFRAVAPAEGQWFIRFSNPRSSIQYTTAERDSNGRITMDLSLGPSGVAILSQNP